MLLNLAFGCLVINLVFLSCSVCLVFLCYQRVNLCCAGLNVLLYENVISGFGSSSYSRPIIGLLNYRYVPEAHNYRYVPDGSEKD